MLVAGESEVLTICQDFICVLRMAMDTQSPKIPTSIRGLARTKEGSQYASEVVTNGYNLKFAGSVARENMFCSVY